MSYAPRSMPPSEASEKDALLRMRRGHREASRREDELRRAEGPQREQAIAEALSALNALADMGLWPGPRDPGSEREVEEVRQRWARIQANARKARTG